MPTCGTPSSPPTLVTCSTISPAVPSLDCASPIRTVMELRADPPRADGTIVFWSTPVVWSYSGNCVIATPGKEYIHSVITCCDAVPPKIYDSTSDYLVGQSCYNCLPDNSAYLQYTIDLTGKIPYAGPCSPSCIDEIAKEWTLTWDTDRKWTTEQFTFGDETEAAFVLTVTEEPGAGGDPVQKIKLTLETPQGVLAEYVSTYWNYVTTLTTQQTAISDDIGGEPFWPTFIDVVPVNDPPFNHLTTTGDAYLRYFFDLTTTPVSGVQPELATAYTLVNQPYDPYKYRTPHFEKDGTTYWWSYTLGNNDPTGPIALTLNTGLGTVVTYTAAGGNPLSDQTLTRQTVDDDLGGPDNWPLTITVSPTMPTQESSAPPDPALCADLLTSEQAVLTIESPCDCEDTGAGSPMNWGGASWDTSGHNDCGAANNYHLYCSGDVWLLTSDTTVCHTSMTKQLVYSRNSPFMLIFREEYVYTAKPPTCDACASATGYIYYTITK